MTIILLLRVLKQLLTEIVNFYVTLQQNNLSLSQPCGSICSPPTEQELVNLQNLHAVHTLTSGRENALKYLQQQQQQQQLRAQLLSSLMFNKVTPTKEQILNRWSSADNNGNPLYKNPRTSPIGAGMLLFYCNSLTNR